MNNRERKFVYKLAGYDNGVYMIELEETIDRLKRRNKKLKQENKRLNKIIDDIKNVIKEEKLWIYVDENYDCPYIAVKYLVDILQELKEDDE